MITYGIPSLFYFVLKYFFKISQITNLVEKENQNHTFKFLSKSTNSIQLPLHLKFPEFSQTLSPIRPPYRIQLWIPPNFLQTMPLYGVSI